MAYIKVRVKTGCRRESATQVKDRWEIAVREKAERGAANARVTEILAARLNVPHNTLRLVKGAMSPSKLYLLINK